MCIFRMFANGFKTRKAAQPAQERRDNNIAAIHAALRGGSDRRTQNGLSPIVWYLATVTGTTGSDGFFLADFRGSKLCLHARNRVGFFPIPSGYQIASAEADSPSIGTELLVFDVHPTSESATHWAYKEEYPDPFF